MKDSNGGSSGARPTHVPAGAALLVILALVVGCGSGYEKISAQSYDTDYEVFSLVSRSGNLDVFFIKAFESDGKVALCGGFTQGTSTLSTIGNRRWADISQIYIDDMKIGTASFMAQIPIYGFKEGHDPKALFLALQEKSPAMPCVRSKVLWKAEYESAKIERRGPQTIRVED